MKFNLFIAIAILIRIALFVYFVLSGGHYMTFDSPHYIELAANVNTHLVFSLSEEAPFAAHVWRTPGYPLFIALISALGMKNLYWVTFWQEVVYILFAFIFYRYSKPFFTDRLRKFTLLFILLEPGGLAFSKQIMSEVLFMPLLLASLLAIAYYLRHQQYKYLIYAGALMGVGALVRPAILYLPIVVCTVIVIFHIRQTKVWLHVSFLLAAFILALSPWLARNYYHYGKIYMSGQSSYGLAYFHVPIVKGHATNMSYEQAREYVANRVRQESLQQIAMLGRQLTPLEVHQLEQKVAIAELSQYPGSYLYRWIIGSIRCMLSPLIIELYEVYKIPAQNRLQLLQVLNESPNLFSGFWHYLTHQDKLYLLDVIFSVMLAMFALLGALRIITMKNCFLWILMLSNFYFICIPGPMSHGRFRVPVELYWFIQAYYGWEWVLQGLRQWRKSEPLTS